jgi:hypothetical protein
MMSDDEEDYNVKEMMRKVAKPANQEAAMTDTVIHEGYAVNRRNSGFSFFFFNFIKRSVMIVAPNPSLAFFINVQCVMSVKRWIYVANVWKKEHLKMVKIDITFFFFFFIWFYSFPIDHHTLEHTFEVIRTANQFPYYADNDYNSPEHLGEYSYLGF